MPTLAFYRAHAYTLVYGVRSLEWERYDDDDDDGRHASTLVSVCGQWAFLGCVKTELLRDLGVGGPPSGTCDDEDYFNLVYSVSRLRPFLLDGRLCRDNDNLLLRVFFEHESLQWHEEEDILDHALHFLMGKSRFPSSGRAIAFFRDTSRLTVFSGSGEHPQAVVLVSLPSSRRVAESLNSEQLQRAHGYLSDEGLWRLFPAFHQGYFVSVRRAMLRDCLPKDLAAIADDYVGEVDASPGNRSVPGCANDNHQQQPPGGAIELFRFGEAESLALRSTLFLN